MFRVPCWKVNAFTPRPFAGNPAAVCWLEQDVPDHWMQAVAAEMNLAETAFVRPRDGEYELRWFTPQVEVDLCGHATLASAHALWTAGLVDTSGPIRFLTRSGLLLCTRQGRQIELDFPALPATAADPQQGLLESLGVDSPEFVGRTKFDTLVQLRSADEVRSLQPDFRKLVRIPTRGVIVTALSDNPQYDFVSRFFASSVGIDEDPVCGSAHCSLAPFWAGLLGKQEFTAHQASARGGVLRLKCNGDRVVLGGEAVLIWRGEVLAGPESR